MNWEVLTLMQRETTASGGSLQYIYVLAALKIMNASEMFV